MENFSMKEIPFENLALLGMTKENFLSLPGENLIRLMSGQRTDVLRFDFYHDGQRFFIDAKLMLARGNNSVKALMVPVRKQIKNDFNLTRAEQIKLYAGKLINKRVDGQRYLLQLDRETNEILRAKALDVKLPFNTGAKDREKLLSGKSIQIDTETGRRSVKINLLDEKRFAVDGEQPRLRYVGAYFTDADIRLEDKTKYGLSEQNVQKLLDGYKTSLVESDDGRKVKLGLTRNNDKSVSLQVFPIKNELDSEVHLDPQQIEKLQRGETVSAEIRGKSYICQLDEETNSLLRAQKESVVPGILRGHNLTNEEKESLINGRPITFSDTRTGEPVTAKLNLTHVRGVEIKDDANILRDLYTVGEKAAQVLKKQIHDKLERDKFFMRNNLDSKDLSNSARAAFDERQKFYFDYHNPGVMSYIQTDRNKSEFMMFCQSQTPTLSPKL
ncbi:MAG: DUF4099 domain-containing protein [Dysgonamonadaceae bacterium]|jgi:hypothetical protein|nr:DUF4099 domain-containing protein [Dysgonamonadaceae bacterium]